MISIKNIFTFSYLFILSIGFGQDISSYPKLIIDLPVIDAPFIKSQKLGDFSMQQSTAISTDFYSTGHYFIKKAFAYKSKEGSNKIWDYGGEALSLAAFNFLANNAPFGITWNHEEYHRSIMTLNKVHSYNDAWQAKNAFNPLGATSVSNVSDDELGHFKKDNPLDFIRLKSAGIEAETMLPISLQNNNFYYNLNLPNTITYLIANIGPVIYLNATTQKTDSIVDYNYEKEFNANISKRDFAGADFTSWIYDMNRPGEAYEKRGIHPSGNGIKRYVWFTDLAPIEVNYLKKMTNRQLLNLVSPMNFFINDIKLNDEIRFNFGFQHFLTSFGDDTGMRLLINYKKNNFFFAYHNFQNKENTFPAFEAQWLDHPIKIGNKSISTSFKTIIGTQPKIQSFTTAENQLLAFLYVKMEYPISKTIFSYISINGKTDGWIAGNPFLKSNLGLQLGMQAKFY